MSLNSFLKKIIKKSVICDEKFHSSIVKIEYGDKTRSSELNSRNKANLFFKNSSMFILNRKGYSSSVGRRIFWMTILLICAGYCISQIYQFLSAYYAYPVIVNIESNIAKYLEFPGVTICNMNDIRKEFQYCAENGINYHKCLNLSKPDEKK